MIEKQEQPDLYHFALGFFNLLPQMSPGKELLLKSLVIPDDSRLYPILRYLTDHVQEELRMDEVALRITCRRVISAVCFRSRTSISAAM